MFNEYIPKTGQEKEKKMFFFRSRWDYTQKKMKAIQQNKWLTKGQLFNPLRVPLYVIIYSSLL